MKEEFEKKIEGFKTKGGYDLAFAYKDYAFFLR